MQPERSPPTRLVVALIGTSHVFNHAYFTLLPPVFGPLDSELGITTTEAGIAVGVVGAFVVALQLPFGYLSDTRSRSLTLTISLVVGTAGALLTAVAWNFTVLLVGASITGIGIGAHHAAHYPMLSAVTEPGERGRVFSIHSFTGALGFALPFSVVGVVTTLGYDWRLAVGGIAVAGGLFTLAALWALRRHVPDSVTRAPGSDDRESPSMPSLASLPGRLRRGVAGLAGSRGIVLLTVLWFLTSMITWGIQTYTGTLLAQDYGVAEGTASLVVSVMLGIGAVATLAGGWLSDRFGSRVVILTGFLTLMATTGVLAAGVLPVVAALGLTLWVASTVKIGLPALTKLGDRLSASDDLGKNFGLLTIGISGGGAVAPPVFGTLADVTSIGTVFWTLAGLGAVSFLFTFVVLAAGERSGTNVATPAE